MGVRIDAVVDMPNGSRFTVAYLPWTGHWYAFDIETGKKIATFTSEFYEPNIAPLATILVPDPGLSGVAVTAADDLAAPTELCCGPQGSHPTVTP